MLWWHWVALGLALACVELFSPGLHVGFFGVSAIVVGLLVAAGLAEPAWLQWLLFSAIAVVSLLALRKPLLDRLRPALAVGDLAGETAVASEDIPAGAIGRVELHGATWQARNDESDLLVRGQRCRVERVEGLLLRVRAESSPAG